MNKLFKKQGYIYSLHRSDSENHNHGRPAILLKYLGKESLIWFGTTKLRIDSEPVFVKQLNKPTYFYATGIDKVNSDKLKNGWNLSKNKNYKLSSQEYKDLIGVFANINNIDDPYKEINKLKEKFNELEEKVNNIINFQMQKINDLILENNKLKELITLNNCIDEPIR
ncbi:MAG: hypothetical protein OHM56_03040 [Spiroplasma phoeniceum]|nr:MAG: hypothetical protein OHM57_02490 [Spiroplasma phoeniceum]UZQ32941.1 MAG: hypothetical protein OHM56_03040 [Spiroplasma phoeniceum]